MIVYGGMTISAASLSHFFIARLYLLGLSRKREVFLLPCEMSDHIMFASCRKCLLLELCWILEDIQDLVHSNLDEFEVETLPQHLQSTRT